MHTALALIDSWVAEDAAVAARRAELHLVPTGPSCVPAASPKPTTLPALRFLWNGIKGQDGKLQGARYNFSPYWPGYQAPNGRTIPPRAAHITIHHNSHCGGFEADVWAAFKGHIRNDTDSQTDYFTNDSITVEIDHPLFRAVALATIAQEEHRARHADKMAARRSGRPNGDSYRKSAATLRSLIGE